MNNRLIVLLLLVITIGIIGWQLPNLKLDAFPDVTNVQVQVNTEAEGLAAEEVEQLITYPIEAVMYALPQVAEVRSISKTGLSIVTVVFEEGTDIYFARQLVFERLQAAREDIPDGVGTPEMGPNTSGLGQVYQYLLTAEPGSNVDAIQMRSLNDWVVKLLLVPVGLAVTALARSGFFEVPERPYPQLTYDPQSARRHYRARPAIVAARALEIGWKSAGFGAAIARDYLKGAEFMASNAPRRAEQLTALLTELGPTFIKLGQSASIRSDLLPPAYCAGLQKLQDKVQP